MVIKNVLWQEAVIQRYPLKPEINIISVFMKDFKLVLSFCDLWSRHPKYLGSCKQLFEATGLNQLNDICRK